MTRQPIDTVRRLARHALVALALLVCAAPPSALTQAAARAPAQSPTLEAARVRWERLTPAEQARLRAHYERYRELSEEERRALGERARTLRDTGKRVQEE